MVTETKNKVVSLDGLPDISEDIAEVMIHYSDSFKKSYGDNCEYEILGKFVEAWLSVQKNRASEIVHNYRNDQLISESKTSPFSSS